MQVKSAAEMAETKRAQAALMRLRAQSTVIAVQAEMAEQVISAGLRLEKLLQFIDNNFYLIQVINLDNLNI